MGKFLKIYLVLCVSTAVTACGGWHLRGSGEDSAVGIKVFVKSAAAPTVGPALITELRNRGATLVGSRSEADAVIAVVGENYGRRILSVDPATGKVREIELGLTTDFSIRGKDGQLLIPRETVAWQLDYVFDEGSVLGTTAQDVIIQLDLAAIAATAMVLRLQSAKVSASELKGE